jgi:hypothetical protein
MVRKTQEPSTSPHKAAASADTAPLVAHFVRVLAELRDVYRELAPLGALRRKAVRNADARAFQHAIEAEAALAMRLRELNRRRVASVDAIVRLTGRPEQGEPTAIWLSEQLPPEIGESLREAAEDLRLAIVAVQQDVATDRMATEAIASHLRGLVRSVGDGVSHARTYSRAGEVERGRHQVVSMMDVTS